MLLESDDFPVGVVGEFEILRYFEVLVVEDRSEIDACLLPIFDPGQGLVLNFVLH
ncbi:hypothetical protein DPMN_008084 [Dreissena polymorpha]|uniref:Uncharacterized protein n=1 Tax=Dreissena polymorpha TaxID=45954 RepID=A0A9D4MY48_DREPO|nr:hypothetical protein DPMN_008084 [Dreissena polymorpha]